MTSKKGGLREKLRKLLDKIIHIDFKTDNPMAISAILLMLIISVTLIATTKNLIDVTKTNKENVSSNERVQPKVINDKKSNVSVYKKLRVGENINTLVLGDDIGNGGQDVNKESWVSQLASWIGVKYGITDNTTNLSLNDGTAYSEFNELMENKKENYDLVLIVLGKNDEKQVGLDEFGITYEGIIRELRKLNINTTVVPVIEDSMSNDEYINKIIDLSKHYNLDYVNAKDIEKNLKEEEKVNNQDNNEDKSDKDNDSNSVDINELYFKAINNTISNNVGDTRSFIDNAKDREKRRNISPFYSEVIDLDSYKCVVDYKNSNGFNKGLNLMESKNLGASIEYEVPGNTIGLMYKGDNDGAKMQIYINDKLCKEIDTKDSEAQNHYVMVATDEEQSNNGIKIVQATGTKESTNDNNNDKKQVQQTQNNEAKGNISNSKDNKANNLKNSNVNNESNNNNNNNKSNTNSKNSSNNKKNDNNTDKSKENNDKVIKIICPIGYNVVSK